MLPITCVFIWARTAQKANRFKSRRQDRVRATWIILSNHEQLTGLISPVVIAVGDYHLHPEYDRIRDIIYARGGVLVHPETHIRLFTDPEPSKS